MSRIQDLTGGAYDPKLNPDGCSQTLKQKKETMKAKMIHTKPSAYKSDTFNVIMGGDGNNPTWREYIQTIGNTDVRRRFRAIKKLIIEMDLVGELASHMANDIHFEFDDDSDVKIALTWRAWGDLMQAIVGKREGYMKYYC